ncbi:type II secretion system protein GspM [Caulobacter endophyticus]|uniref:type II secretion system protein GspM n=1 Tax=Caulobacter endophyticus TaxID=2172652 RepID=UPI002410533E|nr:type II secretion system protein GspM [Caulobacter endophyticus]MDG2531396.1 type II secretion system protein GspM [Caulobacter endophyticus]
MNRIAESWNARTPRERVMLAVMAVAVLGVGGFYGVVVPLKRSGEAARERLTDARELSAALAAATGVASPAKAAAGPVSTIVETSAASLGVPIARKRQEGDGAFTIWINAIDARTLLPWVASLERETGLSVAGFTASRLDNGLVEAEVTFARGVR